MSRTQRALDLRRLTDGLGVTWAVLGDSLLYRPRHLVDDALLSQLKEIKPEFIRLISDEGWASSELSAEPSLSSVPEEWTYPEEPSKLLPEWATELLSELVLYRFELDEIGVWLATRSDPFGDLHCLFQACRAEVGAQLLFLRAIREGWDIERVRRHGIRGHVLRILTRGHLTHTV